MPVTPVVMPNWGIVQIFSRLAILFAFGCAIYLILAIFSQPFFARIFVYALFSILLLAAGACIRNGDWRALRILLAPLTLLVVVFACIQLEWIPAYWYTYVTAAFGLFLSETMVIMSVCGSDPLYKNVQYVTAGVGLFAPLIVSLVGLFAPSWILFYLGIFASLLASGGNILFNKP